EHFDRQRQIAEPGELTAQPHDTDIVLIKIDETQLRFAKVIAESGRSEQVFDIAAMAGSFAHHHFARTGMQESGRRTGHEERMRIDGVVDGVFDEVWFQEDRAALHVETQLADTAPDDIRKVDIVARRRKEPDSR